MTENHIQQTIHEIYEFTASRTPSTFPKIRMFTCKLNWGRHAQTVTSRWRTCVCVRSQLSWSRDRNGCLTLHQCHYSWDLHLHLFSSFVWDCFWKQQTEWLVCLFNSFSQVFLQKSVDYFCADFILSAEKTWHCTDV